MLTLAGGAGRQSPTREGKTCRDLDALGTRMRRHGKRGSPMRREHSTVLCVQLWRYATQLPNQTETLASGSTQLVMGT